MADTAEQSLNTPFVTVDAWRQSISMMLDDPNVRLVLVEGEADYKVYRKLFCGDYIQYYRGKKNHKQTIIDFMQEEKARAGCEGIRCRSADSCKNGCPYKRLRRVIAVLDADFDRIQKKGPRPDKETWLWSIFLCDAHDLETQAFYNVKTFDHFLKDSINDAKSWKYGREFFDTCNELVSFYGGVRLLMHDKRIKRKPDPEEPQPQGPFYEDVLQKITAYVDLVNGRPRVDAFKRWIAQAVVEVLSNHPRYANDDIDEDGIIKAIDDRVAQLGEVARQDVPQGHDLGELLAMLFAEGALGIRHVDHDAHRLRINSRDFFKFTKKIEFDLRGRHSDSRLWDSRLAESVRELCGNELF
ncbi:MAG: hypothetical protein JW839_18995 [Candidatus Lokiarchaeota archaeon]|nr:hypothetical protein [Candidatus Lokiarchaeota archaeon]